MKIPRVGVRTDLAGRSESRRSFGLHICAIIETEPFRQGRRAGPSGREKRRRGGIAIAVDDSTNANEVESRMETILEYRFSTHNKD